VRPLLRLLPPEEEDEPRVMDVKEADRLIGEELPAPPGVRSGLTTREDCVQEKDTLTRPAGEVALSARDVGWGVTEGSRSSSQ
jgi:hypothetical protein